MKQRIRELLNKSAILPKAPLKVILASRNRSGCRYCGAGLSSIDSRPPRLSPNFCSLSCQARQREIEKGHLLSESRICERCGSEYRVRGRARRASSRFCSTRCLAAANGENHRGEGHWNWKGGVTEENARLRNVAEYKQWAHAVYERDRWTCQRCGVKCHKKRKYSSGPRDIVAHHIKGFRDHPELRYDVQNGETLCRSCHKKEHYDIGEGTRFDSSRANQPLPADHRSAIAIAQQRIAAEYAMANGFAEDRKCQQCGEIFPRNRFENGRIEDWLTYNKRKFCSRSCRNNARFAASTPEERSAAYAEEHGFKEDKHCEHCGQHFGRQCGGEKGTILPWPRYLQKKYCTPKCAALAREAAK